MPVKTIDETIRVLDGMPTYIFTDDFRIALMDAVIYLKNASPKPALNEPVRNIKYFRGYKDDWKNYRHEITRTWIEDMTIGDLVELVKNGGLDNDKFSNIHNRHVRRLEWTHRDTIKRMLVTNGYLKAEELPKGVE